MQKYLPMVIENTMGAEIVVADNGSTDGSVEWLRKEYPYTRLIALDKNYGFAEGYNQALKKIDNEYYVLLNSDVRTPMDWLYPLVEYMEQHPECAACQPKILSEHEPEKFEYAGAAGGFIDYLGYPFCRGRILSTVECDNGQYDDCRDIFWASGAAMCCRSKVYHELGGFDADFFAHMEEIDLQWRIQLSGWRIMIEPRSKVYHLGGGTLPASPRKVFLNHRNNLAMLYKCSTPLQRAVVAVVRPFTDMAEAVIYLITLQPRMAWSVVKAWWEFIKWHKMLSAKRKSVVRATKVCGIYFGSIVLRYMFGKRQFKDMM